MSVKKEEIKKYFHKQVGCKECWYACFLMVYDYTNRCLSDYEEGKNLVRKLAPETADVIFEAGADMEVVHDLLREYVSPDYVMSAEIDAECIQRSLANNKPVILGLDYGTDMDAGGHYVVVIDIDTASNIITVLNPLERDGNQIEVIPLPSSGEMHYCP